MYYCKLRRLLRLLLFILVSVLILKIRLTLIAKVRARGQTVRVSESTTSSYVYDNVRRNPEEQLVVEQDVVGSKQQEYTSPEIFKERKAQVDDVCAKKTLKGRVYGVLADPGTGVIYCTVPKTGCTFWKRVFIFRRNKKVFRRMSFLTQPPIQEDRTVLAAIYGIMLSRQAELQTPWNISRSTAHRHDTTSRFSSDKHSPNRYPTRLLVSRDPFSRLLSTYLDKIYLPDFWRPRFSHFATDAYQYHFKKPPKDRPADDFMRRHFDELARRFEPEAMRASNTTWHYVKSVKYLTFADFVRVTEDHNEPHWMPVSSVCNPCLFKPTHISKMETFVSDAKIILDKLNMGQFLDSVSDDDQQVDEEFNTLLDYNFRIKKLGQIELAFRLWHQFQWRGYIHPDVEYVIPHYTSEEQLKKDILKQLNRARQLGLRNPEAMAAAKTNFKINAYRSLDKTVFQALTVRFAHDFDLFGYEQSLSKMRKIVSS